MIENGTKRYHKTRMKHTPFFAGALLLAVLAGCSGPQLLNAVTSERGYEAATNLVYDADRDLRLDVYTPRERKRAPVVVYFYGGRWTDGDKAEFRFVAQALTAQGYVAVLPNYRKYPDVRFPEFVRDGAAAIKWVRENVATYGGDPQQLFVMGHSSGAHIAAMLALDERFLAAVGGSHGWLKGMIGLAGPYDFLPITDPVLRDIFGAPEDFPQSQPIFHVDGQNPPMLLLHGEDDESVLVKNTRNLARAVARAGGPVEMVIYPKMSHAKILATVSSRLSGQADVLEQIAAFIDRIAGGKAGAPTLGGVQGRALATDREQRPQALPLPAAPAAEAPQPISPTPAP